MDDVIGKLATAIVNPALKLMYGIAFLVFLWGVFEFIKGADNEDARKIGAQHMLWGVIGLAIMVSAQGIVALIGNTVKGL